ncbi:MAG TPA: twin-arginine translocation pathway signal protein [Deltaproteobacteria bacterium]|nr:twin-arginine translocation pathway signal protein [Deltaproteobacteria bacterium]
MMRYYRLTIVLLVLGFAVGTLINPIPAMGATAAEINRDAKSALEKLYAKSSAANALGEKAIGVLVFPGITKGGFMVGGQYGEGALLKKGKSQASDQVWSVTGYYNTVQLSYGFQAGIQKFGYALFLMTDSALSWINKSDGWEVGVGPSIVVVDVGAAKSLSTTTLQSEIYAFFFDQKGLMGGLGLQGTKITKIKK